MNGFELAVESALAEEQWGSKEMVVVVAKQRQRIQELEAEVLRLSMPWPDDFFMLAEEMEIPVRVKADGSTVVR